MSDKELPKIRHSLAHLLGAAVLELYPGSKLAIGPAIDDGFYYDIRVAGPPSPEGFGRARKISDNDLPRIEIEMRKILEKWEIFEQIKVSAEETKKIFVGNNYKLELIDEIEKNKQPITLYYSGPKQSLPTKTDLLKTKSYPFDKLRVLSLSKDKLKAGFIDLCRGGHVESAKDINPEAFKLSHVAGAYWRGNKKNPQLTRIYGLAFETKKDLDAHIAMLEEAKKRDHKKLGIELDLFTFSDLVGSGLPLWTPKGTLLRNLLDDFVRELRRKAGYQQVDIPHITKKELYEKSGHWDKFKDELFLIKTREGHEFAMKPMNCPHHTQIYARKPHSYRELPQRYANTTKVYRDEQSGELAGLSRVRSITQDDAHIFCRFSDVKNEMFIIWDIIEKFYKTFGLRLLVRISTRDIKHPEKYLGDSKQWDKAEKILQEVAAEKNNMSGRIKSFDGVGEANFYGPKLDFMAQDSLEREWQVATIQLDMNMPERFDLNCINEKGEKERIVIIHAAIMGSIERFLSVIIEHFAGAFPVWLSPVQAIILPISDKQNEGAEKILNQLKEAGIRAEINSDNETLGKKIRSAELQKIPYLLVVGDKELQAGTVAVRQRGKGDIGQMEVEEFIKKIREEIETKKP